MYPCIRLAHSQIPRDPDTRWRTVVPVIETLKSRARALGLWNLFLSRVHYPAHGVPLSNVEVGILSRLCVVLAVDRDVDGAMTTRISGFWFFVRVRGRQYAVMAEVLGRGGHVASEVVNCSAPDTGNMGACSSAFSEWTRDDDDGVCDRGARSVWLARATADVARPAAQRRDTLLVRDDGALRYVYARPARPSSVFMEISVSSSDARNIKTSIRREGDEIVVTGHKWSVHRPWLARSRLRVIVQVDLGRRRPPHPCSSSHGS